MQSGMSNDGAVDVPCSPNTTEEKNSEFQSSNLANPDDRSRSDASMTDENETAAVAEENKNASGEVLEDDVLRTGVESCSAPSAEAAEDADKIEKNDESPTIDTPKQTDSNTPRATNKAKKVSDTPVRRSKRLLEVTNPSETISFERLTRSLSKPKKRKESVEPPPFLVNSRIRNISREENFMPKHICDCNSQKDFYRRLSTFSHPAAIASGIFSEHALNPEKLAARGWEFEDAAILALRCEYCCEVAALSSRLADPLGVGHSTLVQNYYDRVSVNAHWSACPWKIGPGCSKDALMLPQLLPKVRLYDIKDNLQKKSSESTSSLSPDFRMSQSVKWAQSLLRSVKILATCSLSSTAANYVDSYVSKMVTSSARKNEKGNLDHAHSFSFATQESVRTAIACSALGWSVFQNVTREPTDSDSEETENVTVLVSCERCARRMILSNEETARGFCPVLSHHWYCAFRTLGAPDRLKLLCSRISRGWEAWMKFPMLDSATSLEQKEEVSTPTKDAQDGDAANATTDLSPTPRTGSSTASTKKTTLEVLDDARENSKIAMKLASKMARAIKETASSAEEDNERRRERAQKIELELEQQKDVGNATD